MTAKKASDELIGRLRSVALTFRTKPYPISDLIPLLQEAADALESRPNLECKSEQKRLATLWGFSYGPTTTDAETRRLAGVALRESAGVTAVTDWQGAALSVCKAVVGSDCPTAGPK